MEHKNAEVIKAWADGKVIQFQIRNTGNWKDFQGKTDYEPHLGPWTDALCNWRVKPKEPEVEIKWVQVGYGDGFHHVEGVYSENQPSKQFFFSDSKRYHVTGTIRLTTDAETGKILAVELIKE